MSKNNGQYGRYYWCVKVPKTISRNGEIYLNADSVEVMGAGSLVFWQHKGEERIPVMAMAAGKWETFYAASVLDGHPVAVDHWAGELLPA